MDSDFHDNNFRTGLQLAPLVAGVLAAVWMRQGSEDVQQWAWVGPVVGAIVSGVLSLAYQLYLKSCAQEDDATKEEKS